MTVYKWSQTAASDASADPSINWAEGQSPASINDSARAMMAAVAKYRDDIAGAILTAGTSTAYTVSSYQQFDSLAHLDGKEIAFTPHVTNVAGSPNVTLNVDGLGAKTLRADPANELLSGVLIAGTPYAAVYNATSGIFFLRGVYGNPYNVPLLGGMDYWDTVAPNSSFIFPQGQAISRTVYSAVFAKWGTKFGAGDGSTTFNVPDKRGRVSAMIETAASRLTGGYFGGDSTQLGGVGGSEYHVLAVNEMPQHNHGVNDPGHTHTFSGGNGAPWGGGSGSSAGGGSTFAMNTVTIQAATTNISIQNAGNGAAHAIVQPTICCNYIIRVL